MPKVFISHSTRDRAFVEREIVHLLSQHGIETWFCKDDIRTADEWERTIFKGLESCEWFLLAMSAHAAESEWVKDEVHWAIDERPGKIVPVLIGACKPRDFHIRMGRIQYVDFLQNRDEAKVRLLRLWGIEPIVTTVETASSPTPAAPPTTARPQPAPLRKPFAEQRRSEGHTGAITCLAISPDGRFAASGSRDATARLWDLSGTKPALPLAGHTKPVGSVAFFNDCARVLTSSADQSVRIFEIATGRELRLWPQRANWAAAIFDDYWVYSGSPTDNALVAWNPQTGHEYRRIGGHTEPVRAIALGRQTVVTTSRDQTLRIWDVERWQLRAIATVPKVWLSTIAVDANRQRVVAGSGSTVGIWDLRNGTELARLHGHAEDVVSVAISADGRRIVSGSVDGSLRVWDTDTCQEIACGTGHQGEVSSVAITPDGVHALSGGEDRTVRLWRMPE